MPRQRIRNHTRLDHSTTRQLKLERLEPRRVLAAGHFAATFGTSSNEDIIRAVAADEIGDAYVAGDSNEGVFVGKFDFDGSDHASGQPGFLWQRSLSHSGTGGATGVEIDSVGSVYLVGEFGGSLNFDPGQSDFTLTSPADNDAGFIAKYDAIGQFEWAHLVAGGVPNSIALTESTSGTTRLFIEGSFGDSVSLASQTVNNTAQTDSDFLTELSGDGAVQWLRGVQSQGNATTYDVAANEDGIYVVLRALPRKGKTKNVKLDEFELTPSDESAIYVAKLERVVDSGGQSIGANFVWVHEVLNSAIHNQVRADTLEVSPTGAIYVGGWARDGSVTLANGDLHQVRGSNWWQSDARWRRMFVVRVDELTDNMGTTTTSNTWAYSPSDGTDGATVPDRLAVDAQGNLVVSGFFSHRAEFAAGVTKESRGQNDPNAASKGQSDSFVLRLRDEGSSSMVDDVWQIGGPGEEEVSYPPAGGLATLPDGRVLVAGAYANWQPLVGPPEIEFPGGTRFSYDSSLTDSADAYLAIINPTLPVNEVEPAQPTNLSGQIVDGVVHLSWEDKSANAVEFIVQRGNNPSNFEPVAWQEIDRTQGTTYQDTTASGAVLYRVLAVDGNGNESFVSHFVILSVPSSDSGGGGKGGGKGGGPKSRATTASLAIDDPEDAEPLQTSDAIVATRQTQPYEVDIALLSLSAAFHTVDAIEFGDSDSADDEFVGDRWTVVARRKADLP